MATVATQLNGYVGRVVKHEKGCLLTVSGFDSITRQIERKLLKRGFQFNIILVGRSRVTTVSCNLSDVES